MRCPEQWEPNSCEFGGEGEGEGDSLYPKNLGLYAVMGTLYHCGVP